MATTKTVMFPRSGTYANRTPALPHFTAVEGEPIELDNRTADFYLAQDSCVECHDPKDAPPVDANGNGYLGVKELRAALELADVEIPVGSKRADLLALHKAL